MVQISKMETALHSTDSHPLPHGRYTSTPTNPSSEPLRTANSPLNQTSDEEPIETSNLQTRRLRLRNANFSAPLLVPRRMSPLFGLPASAAEPLPRMPKRETTSQISEKRHRNGEHRHFSPLNILQEIQNSARKKKSSPRPGLRTIFQDQPTMDENDPLLAENSWYNDKSNECSPATIHVSSVAVGLREMTLNPRLSPTRRSPAPRVSRCESLGNGELESDENAQSRYIEHLESQLAAANMRIDALTSPKTANLRTAKLRTLTTENRTLRTENAGWAQKAEELVQQERSLRSVCESELRSKIEDLRAELDLKDSRIAECEWEIESMTARVRNADGLAEANANLEKRIDMLSNLLVQPSNQLGIQSSATSPKKAESMSRLLQRPKSVLPLMPSSPNGLRRALTSVSESVSWDSRSRSPSNTLDTPEVFTPGQEVEGNSPLFPSYGDQKWPDGQMGLQDLASTEQRSQDSLSYCSAPSSSSRPTSFISTSSNGAPIWSAATNTGNLGRRGSKSRRMRRFPSGSNSLKPLILPTATCGPSLPASAPLFQSIDSISCRDVSNYSVDPMSATFLTKFVDSQLDDTPTAPPRRKPLTWVQEQTMKALEGNFDTPSTEPRKFSSASEDIASANNWSTKADLSVPASCGWQERPQSLQEELDQIEVQQSEDSASGNNAHGINYGQNVPDRDCANRVDTLTPHEMPSTPFGAAEEIRRHPNQNATPKRGQRSKIDGLPKRSYKSRPSQPASSNHHAEGLFSRLTQVISQTKQSPVILARRIVNNAWNLGSSSLGGMAWWLLGPLHHHRHTRARDVSNADSAADGQSEAENWSHFTSNSRRIPKNRHEARDYGATWSTHRGRVAPRAEPHLFPCDQCVEPSSYHTIKTWFQFCLTVVLAVGIAVRHGPASLIAELPSEHIPSPPEVIDDGEGPDDNSNLIDSDDYLTYQPEHGIDENATIRVASPRKHHPLLQGPGPSSSKPGARDVRRGVDSGYGSFALTEPLARPDTEAE